MLGDGQAQSGPCRFIYTGVIFPGKRFKYFILKFPGHPYAVIPDMQMGTNEFISLWRNFFIQISLDGSAFRGKLNRIAKNI